MKVLITGASRGIGKALLEIFNKNGFETIGCSRTENIVCDVSDKTQVENTLPKDVDVLINNAGVALYEQIQDTSDYKQVFNINFGGVFNCTKHVLPYMLEKKNGIIYNIASIWGEVGGSCESVYSASKGAVIAFSKALSQELELSNIKVAYNSLNAVDTDMLRENPYGTIENAISAEEAARGIYEEIIQLISQ